MTATPTTTPTRGYTTTPTTTPTTPTTTPTRGYTTTPTTTPVAPTTTPVAPTTAPTGSYATAVVARPRVLILHAPGTNRDREAAMACTLAGGRPEIVHLNQLLVGERELLDYGFLVLPGGFSYGDALGPGRLLALDLRLRLHEALQRFVAEGRPVLGICNGFQALVGAGLLPGLEATPQATLAPNRSGHFECRWVHLRPEPASPCLFTRGLSDLLYVPVAHGDGNLTLRSPAVLQALRARGQIALTYVDAEGKPAGYPANPNGSAANAAGICNPAGNVLGLMPHPEDHVFLYQHPYWTRGEAGGMGLALFANGVRAAGE